MHCRQAAFSSGVLFVRKSVVISSLAAIAAFGALCLLFSGAPDNAGLLASISLVAAVRGLSFALSFAAGLPAPAAILVAIAALALVPVAVFLVTRRLLRRFDR